MFLETSIFCYINGHHKQYILQTGAIAASNWPAAKLNNFSTHSLVVPSPPAANTKHQRQRQTRQDELPGTGQDKPGRATRDRRRGQDRTSRQEPSAGQPAGRPVGRSAGRSAGRPVVRSVTGSIGSSLTRSVVRSVGRSVARSPGKSVVGQLVCGWVGHWVRRSVCLSVCPPFGRSSEVGCSVGLDNLRMRSRGSLKQRGSTSDTVFVADRNTILR